MSVMTRMYYPLCRSRIGHALVRSTVAGVRRFGGLRSPRFPFDALQLDHRAYAGLVTLWSRIHWAAGDGMMPTDELLTIYRCAVESPVDGDIIELGAWIGLTTSYLATACRVRGSGQVWAVDTFAGDREGNQRYPSVEQCGGSTLPEFRRRINRAGVADLVQPLQGRTDEIAGAYPGRLARLLLIDADHSFEGVRDDFRRWLGHVAPGGLIVFHDYRFPGVRRFVDEQVRHDDRVVAMPEFDMPNVVVVARHPAVSAPRDNATVP